jgi:hypothetical protein
LSRIFMRNTPGTRIGQAFLQRFPLLAGLVEGMALPMKALAPGRSSFVIFNPSRVPALFFHRRSSCSSVAPLRMKITSGCGGGFQTAGTLPYKQAFRAATEGSGITRPEGQASVLSELF